MNLDNEVQIEATISIRLRELRRKRGLTLHQFEALSAGAVKAVVLGSYERGTRALSIARLGQLARIYGVPISYFFPEDEDGNEITSTIFDLRKISQLTALPDELIWMRNYLRSIVKRRSDWNGQVLSLRASDLEVISQSTNEDDFNEYLKINGFLLQMS